MKNVQVIDGAINSTFEVYSVPDDIFDTMFPDGSDIAFLAEVENALSRDFNKGVWDKIYSQPIAKEDVVGIHGTLHLTGSICKEVFYPTRKEVEVIKSESE